ncbi:hypothetical protein FN846DRAFT_923949 [Sphaerosporella brunnea]|uniref:Uncharacterized protein n=1 Tax=Sphaerosporella brunnea TaxID=1250544 RepID=A0A5J5ECN0_9PEZI|nr:hypothetical protein FN846DRAFT_923949 [Sphaerosporella brunnea]
MPLPQLDQAAQQCRDPQAGPAHLRLGATGFPKASHRGPHRQGEDRARRHRSVSPPRCRRHSLVVADNLQTSEQRSEGKTLGWKHLRDQFVTFNYSKILYNGLYFSPLTPKVPNRHVSLLTQLNGRKPLAQLDQAAQQCWDPDDTLEYLHDWVQWLIPSPETSPFNSGAPAVDFATACAFRHCAPTSDTRVSWSERRHFLVAADNLQAKYGKSAGIPIPPISYWACDYGALSQGKASQERLRRVLILSLSGNRQSRENLFTECNRWLPQVRELWRSVEKELGWKHLRWRSVAELFQEEKATPATLQFLPDTRVGQVVAVAREALQKRCMELKEEEDDDSSASSGGEWEGEE